MNMDNEVKEKMIFLLELYLFIKKIIFIIIRKIDIYRGYY